MRHIRKSKISVKVVTYHDFLVFILFEKCEKQLESSLCGTNYIALKEY